MTDILLLESEVLTEAVLAEATVWTPTWLTLDGDEIEEGVAAGSPKLGRVFSDDGLAEVVLIRPCRSRGASIRGLQPIYTQAMLKENAAVFGEWPMYSNHRSRKDRGDEPRDVRLIAGQVQESRWDPDYTHPDDAKYGYQKGAVRARVWGTPKLREQVSNNPGLLHLSISAYPKSARSGVAPWNPQAKGMVIEGIRSVPMGSVDFVPRGGAGGRFVLAEGVDADHAPWPVPDLDATVTPEREVSIREGAYDPGMSEPTLEQIREHLRATAPHLAAALPVAPAAVAPPAAQVTEAFTREDAAAMVAEALAAAPSEEQIREALTASFEEREQLREEQRYLSGVAAELIEGADGIPESWKADLMTPFRVSASGPGQGLLVEGDETLGISAEDELREAVNIELEKARDRIAEIKGTKRPRVVGEGGALKESLGAEHLNTPTGETPAWAAEMAKFGAVNEAENAASEIIVGG